MTSQARSPRMLGLGLLAALAAVLAAAVAAPAARAQTMVDDVVLQIVIDDSDATVPPDPQGDRPVPVDVMLRISLDDEVPASRFRTVEVTGLRLRSSGGLEISTGTGTPAADSPECTLADPDDPLIWHCKVGAYSVDLFGAEEGEYTLSASLSGTNTSYSLTIADVVGPKLTGKSLTTATAKLTVATIDEVASVTLELAEDEPSTRAAGGDGINLVLKILNENNAAADPGAISTILVSGPPLTLSSTAGGSSCDGSICQWTVRSVAQLGGRGAESIAIKATSSTPAGGEVTARVVPLEGDVLEAKSPRLTFSGPARNLVIGAPSGALLNEADDGERGTIRFEVTATDSGGNEAEVQGGMTLSIRNPEGRTVPSSGIAREQLSPDSSGRIFIELETRASSESPLAVGEYTLRATRGGASGERTFRVAGKAAQVELSASEPSWSQGTAQVVLTADVTDSEGQSVADGTTVTFGTTPAGTVGSGGAQLVAAGVESPKTSAGRAMVRYLVVTPGRVLVRATADGSTGTEILNIPAAPGGGGGSGTSDPVASLTGLGDLTPNNYTAWFSAVSVQASDLFEAGLGTRGLDAIFKYDNARGRWVQYGESSGQPVPGSVDFTINQRDILWLSG